MKDSSAIFLDVSKMEFPENSMVSSAERETITSAEDCGLMMQYRIALLIYSKE
jgi:hypothetical protein